MIRLLLITPAYPPFAGGGERYVRALARELARQGQTITILTSQATSEDSYWRSARGGQQVVRTQDESMDLIRCPVKAVPGGQFGQRWLRRIMLIISALPGDHWHLLTRFSAFFPPLSQMYESLDELAHGVDLVHGFNLSWEYPALQGWRFARRLQIPFVLTPFLHLGADGSMTTARAVTMDHQRRLLEDADALLTLTSAPLQGLARAGIVPRRSKVLGAGVEPSPVRSASPAGHPHWRLPAPYALFLGRANRGKGAVDAAEATRQLRRQGIGLSLVQAGPMTASFQHYYNQLPDHERQWIRLLGLVSEAEKQFLLSECQMLLLPSRDDALGLVLLEAWAHGKPVIAARAGGLPAVVEAGQDGLLVPYSDARRLAQAMKLLHQQPQLRQRLGRCGQEKVRQQYQWPLVAKRALDIYEALL